MSGATSTTETKGSGARPPGRDGTDLAAVARGAWESRPARRHEDAKIAGVAGALARRYDLDPTLVRVAFVVWAIVGGGLLLYLLGWLALPPDPADPPRHDRAAHTRPHRRSFPTVLVIVTIVVGFATVGNATDGRWVTFVGLALAAVTLYLLHTSRADLGVPGTPGVQPAAAAPVDLGEPVDWDALGADPKGWAHPAPTRRRAVPPPAREPRPRSVLTPVTLALALLAAGLAAVGVLLGVPGMTGVWIPAAALAVVGLGLLVAGVRGRPRRGLVFVAVPLVLATVFGAYAATRADDTDFVGDQRGVGDLVATPTSTAQVLPGYRTGFGDITVDLSKVAPGPPIRTTVESGAGDITVTVPATADVTVTCANGVGDVDCLGRSGNAVTNLVDPGPDGPGGQVVDLTVRNGAGDLAVRRG